VIATVHYIILPCPLNGLLDRVPGSLELWSHQERDERNVVPFSIQWRRVVAVESRVLEWHGVVVADVDIARIRLLYLIVNGEMVALADTNSCQLHNVPAATERPALLPDMVVKSAGS
jgi:hypothetical protein